IRHAIPDSRFLLWTNGTLLPRDCSPFAVFDKIHVTDYGGECGPKNLAALHRACPTVTVEPENLDCRLQGLTLESDAPCQRPYTEFVIDCYGNVHFCCVDWRGLASPGNVLRDGIDKCVANWHHAVNAVIGDKMLPHASIACRRCPQRYATPTSFL
ncbi:MAG: SPASM domain-containing protein, partial [Candidatus Hydrogenedentales bacterium]